MLVGAKSCDMLGSMTYFVSVVVEPAFNGILLLGASRVAQPIRARVYV